eukprot:gene22895-30071_t
MLTMMDSVDWDVSGLEHCFGFSSCLPAHLPASGVLMPEARQTGKSIYKRGMPKSLSRHHANDDGLSRLGWVLMSEARHVHTWAGNVEE